MRIEYKRFNSLWRRISLFFDDHWVLDWIITISSIVGGSILFAAFFMSLSYDKTTNLTEGNKTLYKHIVVIERTYGVTDSLLYYDVNTGVEATLHECDNMLYIRTKGVNWIGASIDNNVIIESTKSFEIIK